MIFSTEQLKALEPYEQYFTTAIRSKYARYPGQNGVKTIHEIFSQVTRNTQPINASCSSCIFRLLVECGNIYFKDKEDLEQQKQEKPKRTKKK